MKSYFTSLLAIGIIASCAFQNTHKPPENATVRNVIIMIGDGMGLTQISTRFIDDEHTTNFNRFKHIGLFSNKPTDGKITDSAAGATAFACGVQTYNGAIGVDADTASVKNMVELLSREGMSSGLVVTSSIVHATPASFYAHVPSRGMYQEIGRQLAYSDIDFFAGGGLMHFFYKRKDEGNYIDTLRKMGFEVYGNFEGHTVLEPLKLVKVNSESDVNAGKKYARFYSFGEPDKLLEGRPEFLTEESLRCINYLNRDPDGFVMMIEGSQIDWAGHDNNFAQLQSEMKEFDDTLGKVLDFAQKDGHTLVIVTADHETGGLALRSDTTKAESYKHIMGSFSTGGHTASLIPVFAYGPGSEIFAGVYTNHDIFAKIMGLLPRGNKKD